MAKLKLKFKAESKREVVDDVLWIANCAMDAISDNLSPDSVRYKQMAALTTSIKNQILEQYPEFWDDEKINC